MVKQRNTGQNFAATSIAINGRAVLICGASGSGKSALALMMSDRGAQLISDDQTLLTQDETRLYAAAHPNIAGKIEVRNIGIVLLSHVDMPVPVCLKINLDPEAPRFIDAAHNEDILGHNIPAISLYPDLSIAPLKLDYALQLYGLNAR